MFIDNDPEVLFLSLEDYDYDPLLAVSDNDPSPPTPINIDSPPHFAGSRCNVVPVFKATLQEKIQKALKLGPPDKELLQIFDLHMDSLASFVPLRLQQAITSEASPVELLQLLRDMESQLILSSKVPL